MCRSTNYYCHGDEDIDPFTFTAPLNSLHGHVAFIDKVNDKKTKPMALVRNNKHRINKLKLEDIPEDKELLSVLNCCCDHDYVYCDCGKLLENATDDNKYTDTDANQELEEALEMDLEVLRRAFDMGIWVVCLGLGYMFSRAKFRPPTFS